jgi:two-component system cell cycle response regulator
MTARILVVDDIPANVKLLEARLLAEYFEVLTAADGMTALSICDQTPCRSHPARYHDARHRWLRGL